MVLAVPIFGFPDQLPGVHKIKAERAANNTIYDTKYNRDDLSRFNDFKLILSNPIWILGTIAACCDSFVTTAMIGFGIKFLQAQFYISAAFAAMLVTYGFSYSRSNSD